MSMRAEMKGMRALRRGLQTIDSELPKAIRADMLEIVKPVAEEIKAVMPKKSGKAAKSVRPGAQASGALIRGGNARTPYFGWLEFGGKLPNKRPRNKKALYWPGAAHPVMRARGATRPRYPEGRYMWPTAERMRPQITEELGRLMVERTERAIG